MYSDYQRPFEARFVSEKVKELASVIRARNALVKKRKNKIIGKISAVPKEKNGSIIEKTSRLDCVVGPHNN